MLYKLAKQNTLLKDIAKMFPFLKNIAIKILN